MILARRFDPDHAALAATRRLRVVSAVLVLGASAWIFASEPSGVAVALGAIGCLVAFGWMAASTRTWISARDHAADHLLLAADRLTLADGKIRHHIDWTEVTDVKVDEERLVVLVTLRGARALRIQPQYQGVSLDELGQAVREAWLDAAPREKC